MNLPMKELEELITNPKKLSKLVLNHLINRLVLDYEINDVQGAKVLKATLLAFISHHTSNIIPILITRLCYKVGRR